MIAVIFEVWPKRDHQSTYLDFAAALKSELEEIDGFISVERFQSLTDPRKLLSLSFWRDEAAIATWRNRPTHRTAQKKGRSAIFQDYRLRIVNVVRDYGYHERTAAPADSLSHHTGAK